MIGTRFLLTGIVLAAVVSIGASPSFAAPDVTRPVIDFDRPHPKPIRSAQTYAVDIDCRKRGADLQPVTDNGLFKTQFTTTFGVLISTEPASKIPDATDKLPESAIGMSVVYVTDGDHGSDLDNRDHGCKRTYLVRRTKDLWIVPFYSLHAKKDAGKIVSVVSAALDPITSLFSLISGGPLAASVTSRITDYKNLKTAFSNLLSVFNQDVNFARSVTLGEGTTTITTAEAQLSIKVKSIPSLIGDSTHDFSDDLRKLGDRQTVKVADPPGNSCDKLNNNLVADGLASDEDRAFVVGYEALKTLTTKEAVMDCLGPLVKVAAKTSAIWEGYPGLTITPDLADEAYNDKYSIPPQLSFPSLRTTLHNLTQAMGRYALNGKAPEYKGAVVGHFSNGATLVDESFQAKFKSDVLPSGVPQILDYLISKGYYHYGCFAQTDDHSGAYTKASAIFLAIEAKPEDTTAPSSKVIAVLPIFADSSRKVQSLKISDSTEWIATLLKKRDTLYDCNGFTIN